jgi:hypothetical protein
MKELIGRLIAYLFLGSFCVAGPLVLMLGVGKAVQRAALVISGQPAQATVIGAQALGSSRVSYAPVFQFTAGDGRSYTVSSDLYGKESDIHFGQRIRVLYWPEHPEAARIDGFAPLWTLPLVATVVGGGFCVVPAIVLVAWMRRRAGAATADKREAARIAADNLSRGLRRTLGLVLIAGGAVLLALAFGNDAHVPMATLGVLLIAAGVQVGQWVGLDSRLGQVCGSLVVTSLAVMFGWVAIHGDAANFHAGASVGGTAVASGAAVAPARIAFAVASGLTALASLWAWSRVFRTPRR